MEIKIASQKDQWIARKIAPCRLKKCSSFVKHFSNFAKRIFEACNFFNLAFIIVFAVFSIVLYYYINTIILIHIDFTFC